MYTFFFHEYNFHLPIKKKNGKGGLSSLRIMICTILYHPGKPNVVVNALSQKSSSSLETLRVRQPHQLSNLKGLQEVWNSGI